MKYIVAWKYDYVFTNNPPQHERAFDNKEDRSRYFRLLLAQGVSNIEYREEE